MGVSNGKITAPVSIGDVSTALGVGNYDLGYLCKNTHGKINMWSKKKPVIYATLGELTGAQLRAASFGLSYTIDTAWNVVWAYNPPTGGDTAPFRLLDFEDYDHNAKSGMAFEQDTYSYDLITGSSNGIEVGLFTDASMITVRDFVNTLFKDCKMQIRCTSYDNTVEYTYQSGYIDVTASSPLQWNLSTTVLENFNIGRVSIVVIVERPDGRHFMPLVKNQAILTITADSGVVLPNYGYSMKIGTTVASADYAYYYRMGSGNRVMDLSNGKNFFLLFQLVVNNSGQTIGSDSLFVQFSWRDNNNAERRTRASIRKGSTLTSWSVPSGNTVNYEFGCSAAEIPVIDSTGAERNVRVVVQVALSQNGRTRYYNVTDTLQFRMKKSV